MAIPGDAAAVEKSPADQSLTARVTAAIGGLFRRKAERPDAEVSTQTSYQDTTIRSVYGWVVDSLKAERDRTTRLKDYDRMDDDSVIVSSALDVYADMATKGSTGKDATDVYTAQIEEKTESGKVDRSVVEAAKNVFKRMEETTKLHEGVWSIARMLAKHGDVFEEVVVNSNFVITRTQTLPAPTVMVDLEMQGPGGTKYIAPYAQRVCDTAPPVPFAAWQVAHFKMAAEKDAKHGRSLLHSCRRLDKQLQHVEDGMVVGRLVRSHQRYAYMIDTGQMPPDKAWDHVDQLKAKHTKRRLFDTKTGTLKLENNPLVAEEDLWLPFGKGSQCDVKILSGSGTLGQIADVQHFINLMFAALKVPKAYLGFEADTRARKVITHLDIQFARTVRRMQYFLAVGLYHIYDVALALAGIEPGAVRYRIIFPAIGTEDEQLKNETAQSLANIMQSLNFIGVKFKPKWLLKTVLQLEDDEAEEAIDLSAEATEAVAAAGGGGDEERDPAALQAELRQQMGLPEGVDAVGALRTLIQEELGRKGLRLRVGGRSFLSSKDEDRAGAVLWHRNEAFHVARPASQTSQLMG